MSRAPTLFPLPPHPSSTRAATRARRNAARQWAAARSLPRWPSPGIFQCRDCEATIGGAVIGPFRELCWDCLPVPGSPLHNWEWWRESDDKREACMRCERPDQGGVWCRGGPFCWDCGKPPRKEYEAWLLAIREAPEMAPPWAGDRKGTV